MTRLFIKLLILLFVFVSCKKDDPEEEIKCGKIKFEFLHYWNDEPVVYDTLIYQNSVGNQLMINEIQYFVSDVSLASDNGNKVIDDWTDIYYVDIDIPSTLIWSVYDKIPVGNYNGFNFVFGIPEEKNIPYMYVNPPERDMFWPYFLGGDNGGYHYMKINGKWLQMPENQINPFDFHLGVGQIYAGDVVNVDSITDFVQNYFTVSFSQSFVVEEDKTTKITLVMNLEEWFQNPNDFDLNYWGGYIMQNQDAMHTAVENGHNVFNVSSINIE